MLINSNADDLQRRLNEVAAASGVACIVPIPGGGYFAQTASATHIMGETSAKASACTVNPSAELSDEQRVVFDYVTDRQAKDALVIAGPGSGKTKTLISCIVGAVQNGTPTEKIAAITFTNNAAAELKMRLCKAATDYNLPALHRVHVSTFHAWVGQLAAACIDSWKHPPICLKPASLAVALHLYNPDTPNHVFKKSEVAAAERHFESCETFAAMEKRNFNRIASGGKNRLAFDNLVKAATRLEAKMKDCQLGTFGTLMKSGVPLAKNLKPGAIAWLFIDEAQDLNAPQADFVDSLQKQTGCRVFAIADDDQGIYKFRGASSRFLREFEQRPNTKKILLERNYRSTEPIVQACRHWITPNWTLTGRPLKKLFSERTKGLPIVVLAASGYDSDKKRGTHARMILEACKKRGLLDSLGEAAVLDYSVNHADKDLKASKLKIRKCSDMRLDEDVLKEFLDMCRKRKAKGSWHHPLWNDFLAACTAGQKPPLGHPGLNDLYAALEAIRRLKPDWDSAAAAAAIDGINRGRHHDFEKHIFTGGRPEPDYQEDSLNYLTLHASKGMEFRAVWLVGCGFAFSQKSWIQEDGQPNSLEEVGVFDFFKNEAHEKLTATDIASKANSLASQLETRRLLYVGMSRATDLVMISAPYTDKIKPSWSPTTKSQCQQDNAFRSELNKVLHGVEHVVVSSDEEADQFIKTITAAHRHPTWSPPHRYRVESFTSLTGQPVPSEEREVEVPCGPEFPRPQSYEAMIGDQFHRIMHLLCLEPDTLQARLKGKLDDAALIARVSKDDPADSHLAPLADLLKNYFADSTNKPWSWLTNSRSEIPLSFVTKNQKDEPILIKGFMDLVQFSDSSYASPTLILDYKNGPPPPQNSEDDKHHAAQLHLYREALATTYSCPPEQIHLINYYPQTGEIRRRE